MFEKSQIVWNLVLVQFCNLYKLDVETHMLYSEVEDIVCSAGKKLNYFKNCIFIDAGIFNEV